VIDLNPAAGGMAISAARIAWRGGRKWSFEVRGLRAERPASPAPGRQPLALRARSVRIGETASPLSGVALSATLVTSGSERTFVVPDLTLSFAGGGGITGTLEGPPRDAAGRSRAIGMKLASSAPIDLAALAPALAWVGAEGWSASGRARFTIAGSASLEGDRAVDLRADLNLSSGGFSAPGEVPSVVAEKIDGRIALVARGPLSPRSLRVEMTGDAGGFEILSGVYYASFAGRRVIWNASGKLEGRRIAGLDARARIPEVGDLHLSGDAALAGSRLTGKLALEIARIDLARLYPLAVSEPLGDAHPAIAGTSMRGVARVSARLQSARSGWTLEGRLDGDGVVLARGGSGFLLDMPEVRLPFHFVKPSPDAVPAAEPGREGAGRVYVARFRAGSWQGGKVLLEPVIRDGGIRLREPLHLPFYGGAIRIENLRGRSILEPGRRITFNGKVSGVDLLLLTKGLGLPEFRGRLDGAIPDVEIRGDRLAAPGRFTTRVFQGEVEVAGVEIEKLFSSLPRIRMDVAVREVELEEATRALKLGRMGGVLVGTIRNLVIERGQPAAFEADFETVERPDHDQWVSADFVKDVATLFGSGNAVSGALNRGVNRFIQKYRYDAFGFTCALRNDFFFPRGKIHKDGVEYLMWGRWNYVRIAVRDPGRGIPFSFMLRQVRTLAADSEKIEYQSDSPLEWIWVPGWFGGAKRAPP
jgi:hypothetical protein